MNKFDINFNNVDPETSRPFSGGHPDGAWVISIIYGLILLFSFAKIIAGVPALLSGNSLAATQVYGGLISYAFLLPTIIFLFKRSEKALTTSLIILVLLLSAFISSYFYNPALLQATLAVCLAQGFICFYIYGLKKDALLPNR